jgi:hypothetical protein
VERVGSTGRAAVIPAGRRLLLSLRNVPCNGRVARAAVVSFARLRDPGLADSIDDPRRDRLEGLLASSA